MLAVRSGVRWAQQPPAAPAIDWSNPFARGLVFCYLPLSGTPADLVAARAATVVGTLPTLIGGGVGKTANWVTTGSLSYPRDPRFELPVVSIAVFYRYGSGLAVLAAKTRSNGGSYSYGFQEAAGGVISFRVNVGGTTKTIAGTSFAGKDNFAVGTYDGATLSNYTNGHLFATLAAAGSLSYDTTSTGNMIVGGQSAAAVSSGWSGFLYLVATWNRVLSAAEIFALSQNPWQLFVPLAAQRFYLLGASSVSLIGLSYAAATNQAQASLNVAASGLSAAVATDNAGATLAAAVAGLIGAKATNAGAILEGIAVSGLSSAVASDTGAVLERVALGGLSAAVATDTGTVLEAVHITGGSFAVATDTGTLGTGAQVGLTGLVGVVATCKGALTVATALQGASSAVASVNGAVSLSVALAGGTFAVAALTGNLISGTQLTLAGLSSAVATNKGTLAVAIGLGGAADAVATLGGTLTQAGRIALGGLSAASATLIGTLTVQGRVIPAEHFDVVFDMRRVLLGPDNRRALIAPDTRRAQLEADGRRTTLQVDE